MCPLLPHIRLACSAAPYSSPGPDPRHSGERVCAPQRHGHVRLLLTAVTLPWESGMRNVQGEGLLSRAQRALVHVIRRTAAGPALGVRRSEGFQPGVAELLAAFGTPARRAAKRRAAERRAADPRTRSCRGHSSESKTPTPTLCTCVGSRGMQNTLVQQWADEIRKFAPHLKVMTADDRSHLVRSLSAPPFSSYTLGEHVAGVLQLQQPKELQRAVPRRFRCGHQAPQALLWHVLLLAALAPKLDF